MNSMKISLDCFTGGIKLVGGGELTEKILQFLLSMLYEKREKKKIKKDEKRETEKSEKR